MNTKIYIRMLSTILRAVTAIILILTNFAGIFPMKSAHASPVYYDIDDDYGGDCSLFGNWDAATRTCTMTTDVEGMIGITVNDMTLEGNGHTLNGPGREYQDTALLVNGPTNVTVQNLTIQNSDRGIWLHGVSQNTVTNVTVNSVDTGIYMMYSSNNVITNNTLENNTRIGLQLYLSSDGNTITGNTISNNETGIWIQESTDNIVSNNNISSNHGGIFLDRAGGSIIENNSVSENVGYGIHASETVGSTMSGNTVSGNNHGIRLDRSGSSVLRNNIITANQTNFYLFGEYDSDYINDIDTSNLADGKPIYYLVGASNQTIDSSSNAATFYCVNCTNVTVKDLTLNKNAGLVFWKTNDSLIENINTTENYMHGIYLNNSEGNTIHGNRIFYNSYYGIYLISSQNNVLTGNYIDNPNYFSIYLGSSSENHVTQNLVDGGNIYLDNSTANQVYNNAFVYMTAIVSGGSGNEFNLTLPNGGNYWSDFDEEGEGCFDVDTDGICDDPFVFSGGQDNLPWIMQVGWLYPPTADAGGPYTVYVGETVTLDASASSDPEGDTLVYEWDLNNDGEYDDATGVTTEVAFDQLGEYSIGLRVTDSLDLTSTDTTTVYVNEQPPVPVFTVHPEEDAVAGWWGFALGTPINYSVDDPATLNNPDFSGTTTVTELSPGDHSFLVYIGEIIDIKPGFEIMVSDGVNTKSTNVTNLQINLANPYTDTISGAAEPGSTVVSQACALGGCKWDGTDVTRTVTANPSGNWAADYSVLGPQGEPIFDISINANIWHTQIDSDGDSTRIQGWVHELPNFHVRPNENEIHAFRWPEGNLVHVTVDDPSTPNPVDYEETQEAVMTEWFGDMTFMIFTVQGMTLQPGQTVTMTDGIVTKTHLINAVAVTNIDTDGDIVEGTAAPGTLIHVWQHNCGSCAQRYPTADSSGDWVADFTSILNPGDSQTLDIQPGTQGSANIRDADGDFTTLEWHVPKSIIWGVTASNNWINGQDWQTNGSVQVSIDDPSTPQSPDSTTTQSTDANGNFSYQSQYEIAVRSVVSVTDGNITKQVTVSNFEVTAFDANANTISGIGTPNATAAIWITDPVGWTSFVIEPSGLWQVDLTEVADITPWSRGFAIEQDMDGDGTQSNWPTHYIQASINRPGHGVEGYDWPLGSPITLTVDNPSNGPGTDYTDVQTAKLDEWNGVQVLFDLEDFRLETGAAVTLTDGLITKTHTVVYLDITDVDTDADRVFGKAQAGSLVLVQFRNGTFRRSVVADQDGNWVADFSTPGPGNDENSAFDIQPGMGFGTRQYGDGGNSTWLYWEVPAFKVIAYPDEDVIAATDFWPGASVTITIDDPDNGPGVDKMRSGVVDSDTGGWNCQTWWGYCFVLDLHEEFDVQAGQLISITDGKHTVSHIVSALSIANVDFTTSTVSGAAEPLSEINLDLWPSCGQRHLFADVDGNWLEDFSVPGDEDFEQETCNFSSDPLRDVVAYQASGEGETWVGWYLPDIDGDGIADDIDNAPGIFNPDQRDVDQDGTADVLDACPDDANNTCDVDGSAANVVGEQGGTVATPDGKASLDILAGSIHEDISFTITDMGSGYEVASNEGPMVAVHSYSIQPSGTQFDPPATITFRWDDVDNDGIVDNTTHLEADLMIIKDGLVITPVCATNPSCDLTANVLTIEVNSLSLFALTVPLNRPPKITSITGPIAPVQIDQAITATVTFNDPDTGDTHTVQWSWGDGSTDTVPVTQPTASAIHNYSLPGVYTVTMTITDPVGEADTASFQYAVIYDPNGGFVTGGGWINSPEGAYTPNPTLTGKATFGFISKYNKGISVPTGNSEFQFHVANLNFKSTSYDWLVIAGSKAKYKGTGTINGTGEYGFMLSAIDGTPDKFRIKIWDQFSGEVVYDNQLGAAEDADPVTAIEGGSIVVHKAK